MIYVWKSAANIYANPLHTVNPLTIADKDHISLYDMFPVSC